MQNFSFCSPTHFEFGKGTESKTAELVKKYGGTKVLLHYGGGSIKKSGLYDRVVKSLTDGGIGFVELGGVQPNPIDTLVYEGVELCRKENVDFILAVGGGSVIDSAKAIALGAVYDGDFWDFFSGTPAEKALPVGVVLTISAAGSEGSLNTVITKISETGSATSELTEDKIPVPTASTEASRQNRKSAVAAECIRPMFAILNPELTQTLPAYHTAAGATDIIVHILERYFSNTENVEVTDRLCEGLLLTMFNQTPLVIADPDNYDARANIMWAGMLAHNNVCGVGRDQDWASHIMEHELSSFFGAIHGAGLAVMSPAWMKFVSKKNPHKLQQFAERIWGVSTIEEGIAKYQAFLKDIGMPSSITEFGATEADIPLMAEHMGLTDEPGFGGYVPLNRSDVEEIYRLAL